MVMAQYANEVHKQYHDPHIDGLVQERHYSSALEMKSLLH